LQYVATIILSQDTLWNYFKNNFC